MWRVVGTVLVGVAVGACSMTRGADPEAALFAALFDVPRGSCKQLRTELLAEIEGIKAAQQKAHDDLVADAETPATPSSKPPRSLRKEDPLASLRDWAKKSEQAEKLNTALKERHCRTVDIEAAVK